jgi:hypothetical protein
MGVSADMKLYLEDLLVLNVYDSFEPDSRSGRIVIITPYGGSPSLFTHDGGDARIDVPRFQVEVRDHNKQTTEALAQDVQNKLCRINNRVIGYVWYLSVFPLSSPAFLRRDAQERFVFVANYEAMKQPDLGTVLPLASPG